MHARILSAQVASYAAYGKPGDPLIREHGPYAGQVIEYVRLLVASSDGTVVARDVTLDPAINGGRPDVGSLCDVDCVVRVESEVVMKRSKRDQSLYEAIINRDKWRAIGFSPVEAPAPVKG